MGKVFTLIFLCVALFGAKVDIKEVDVKKSD